MTQDLQIRIENTNPPYGVKQKWEQKFGTGNNFYVYGTTLYNPSNYPIDDFIFARAISYSLQQGNEVQEWWDKYFESKEFRLKQELAAYRVQFRLLKTVIKDKNKLASVLLNLSRELSGRGYGKMCTQSQAFKLIKQDVA